MLGPLLLMLGLSLTTASSGSLLLNLEGLATTTIAWLVFRENADRKLVLGAGAILPGAILLSWTGDGLRIDTGSLFIAAACLSRGIDNNLSRKLSAAGPVQIAMIKGIVAGTTNLILALSLGATMPATPIVAAGALIGFFGVGISLVMFMLGLRHLATARTGAYFSLASFIGALLSIALFREPLTAQLVGAEPLIAIGLYLHLAERHEHGRDHEVLEHDYAYAHDEHHQHAMTAR